MRTYYKRRVGCGVLLFLMALLLGCENQKEYVSLEHKDLRDINEGGIVGLYNSGCSKDKLSCFESIELNAQNKSNGNQSRAEELRTYSYEEISLIMNKTLPLLPPDSELTCLECWGLERDTLVYAEGVTKDGLIFSIYDTESVGSSGGGWSGDFCFSSSSREFLEEMKPVLCEKNIVYTNSPANSRCSGEESVETGILKERELKSKCVSGEFEKMQSGEYALSISRNGGLCARRSKVGSFPCLR